METYSVNHTFGFIYSFVKYLPLKTPLGYDENVDSTWDNATKFSKLVLGLLGLGYIVFAGLSYFFEDR